MQTRRNTLQRVAFAPTTHAGLWLDKYLERGPSPSDSKEEKAQVAEGKAATMAPVALHWMRPEGYCEMLRRWTDSLEADDCVSIARADARGRLIVGLGHKGVLEAGIRLDATWGVPILPGSALKGMCGATARQWLEGAWQRGDEDYRCLFGSSDEQGKVMFYDAWWEPTQNVPAPFLRDVITVHHADYYAGKSAVPSDTDDPNPVPFVSVRGRYLIAVGAEREEHRTAALRILELGLREVGIGGKTNAGYGRMRLALPPGLLPIELTSTGAVAGAPPKPAPAVLPAHPAPVDAGVVWKDLNKGNAASLVPQMLAKASRERRAQLARKAVEMLSTKWLNDRHEAAWVRELLAAAARDPSEHHAPNATK